LHRLSVGSEAGSDPDLLDGEVKGDVKETLDRGKIQYRMKRFNNEGFLVEEEYDPKKLEGTKIPTANSVATVMLYFDPKKTHTETEIKIESGPVRKILQETLKHYPGYHWENPRLSIFAPFQPLIHNWDALTKASGENPDSQGCKDLKGILDAVKASKEVKEYFEARESLDKLKADNSVAFDFLWTIFPPGVKIILLNSFMKQKQVFIVREASEHTNLRGDRKRYIAITAWAYDWDGTQQKFNRVAVELKIEFYKGQRLITSLPCYPLDYYPGDRAELEKELIERGERFRDLCMRPRGKQMFEYDGLAYFRGTGVRHIQGSQSGASVSDLGATIMPHFHLYILRPMMQVSYIISLASVLGALRPTRRQARVAVN
jgi:hypothetical protein